MKKVIMTLFALLLTGIFIVFKLRENEIGFNNVIDKNNLITVTYSEKDIQYIQDRICLGGINFSELKSYYKIQCLRKTSQGAYVILRQDNGKEAYVFINGKGKVYGMLVIEDFKKKEEFERNISVGMTRDELFAFDATSSGIPVSAVEMTAHLVEEGAFVVRYKREFGEALLNKKTSIIESIEFISNEELKISEPNFYYVLEIDKYEPAYNSDDVVVGIRGDDAEVHSFEVGDYQYYLDNFSSDKVLGSVTDSKDAKEKAESLWIEIYGKDVKKKKPYQVSYDAGSKVWLIQGTLPSYKDGGVPYILIESEEGKVLAVWHDK